ncbi:hypothetical protein [Ramlibacter albus]|uniref:Uncharacterized protein n=1 Tax=Ramlibacter albus TaxID=2079448 RepID=A0A923S5B9_9BURK|nr:hypothetical protein [Ramlibacter albus]MBC5767813.1 hypothetical protein [Ramlibacter albus]
MRAAPYVLFANWRVLQRIRGPQRLRPHALLACSDGSLVAWVHRDRVFDSSGPWALKLLPRLLCEEVDAPPAQHGGRLDDESGEPLDRVCWQLGDLYAVVHGLAPWLGEDRRYELLRWPSFHAIGEDPLAMRVCKRLAKTTCTPVELSVKLDVAPATIAAVLNGLSLCGCLHEARAPHRHH